MRPPTSREMSTRSASTRMNSSYQKDYLPHMSSLVTTRYLSSQDEVLAMTDEEEDGECIFYANNYATQAELRLIDDPSRRSSMLSAVQTEAGMKKSISNIFKATNTARMQYGSQTTFKSRLQQYFIENQKSSLRIRLFNIFIKLASCFLYCVRVINDKKDLPDHVPPPNEKDSHLDVEYLIWVDSSDLLWVMQTVVAFVSIAQTILIFYISYKGNIWKLFISVHFILDMVTSFPYIVTIFFPHLRQLFVPAFLNCWLAMFALKDMMNDLNRGSFMNHSALFRQLLLLFSTLLCLIFTGTCFIQHLQRGGGRQFSLFQSFYFVMVTLSTVGYGDLYPDNWLSQLIVIIMILVALSLLPGQLEALGSTWKEREKSGGDYGTGWSRNEQHVVVSITHLDMEFMKDFLDEFYAHSEHQNVQVVLLSPSELDVSTRMLLKIPLYNSRVHFVRGSALRDEDLERAKVASARAVFVLSARHQNRKITTDEFTVLRSWAMKDYAPKVRQYVQIFRPETKMHVEHAEVLICEDEFKYSLLANNCICPGISTFITLLMHTSRGEEGQKSKEPWHKVYGFHSGNEIYHIRVEDSKFFGDFVGKSFTYASFHAHKSYGIGLIGVKKSEDGSKMMLNPGLNHIIQSRDTLYYMGLTNEESLYDFRKDLKNQRKKAHVASTIANIGTIAMDVPGLEEGKLKPKKRGILQKAKATDEVRLIDVPLQHSSRRPSIAMVTEARKESSSDSDTDNEAESPKCLKCKGACIQSKLQRTYPQVRTYIGTSNTICHMRKEKRRLCCIRLDGKCTHDLDQPKPTSAHEYTNWLNKPIILAADTFSSGMYNLIIPLRAYYRPVHDLHPIVLLLEGSEDPNPTFLDAMCHFPLIYWMKGRISELDVLLRAGVPRAEHVVVVHDMAPMALDHFADCNTIITVQKIHKMFPSVRMITELSHSSNMRFVQFNPNDHYSLEQSKIEKKELKRGSHMPFMFRLPFAAGGVFSANMLDRLLYQSVIKPYVVELTRLLLGIDQSDGSGYLTSFVITPDDLWIKTYGRLYQKLCSSVADIPIGIFRTTAMDSKSISDEMVQKYRSFDAEGPATMKKKKDIYDHVKSKMRTMNMPLDDAVVDSVQNQLSYVIINPSSDLQLEEGDIIYVLRSPVKEDMTNRKMNPRRGLRRGKNVTEDISEPVVIPMQVPTLIVT